MRLPKGHSEEADYEGIACKFICLIKSAALLASVADGCPGVEAISQEANGLNIGPNSCGAISDGSMTS